MKGFLAALTLFTRIPAWKLAELKEDDYRKAVVYWPLTGWITGSVAGGVIYALACIIPMLPAVVLGLGCRMLLTCALHEDGLADFCDGFGGGTDKGKILAIMKDSHIGTYGVVGLIFYFLLEVSILSSMPATVAALAIIAADPFSKFSASTIVGFLDYARPEGAKNKIHYDRLTSVTYLMSLAFGFIPTIPLLLYDNIEIGAMVFTLLVMGAMIGYLKKKISGYTGDCCGAAYLICEMSMMTGIIILWSLWN